MRSTFVPEFEDGDPGNGAAFAEPPLGKDTEGMCPVFSVWLRVFGDV
jgi:hypothetical protein